jgi:hypothetical protein
VKIGAVFVIMLAAASIFSGVPPRTENVIELGVV